MSALQDALRAVIAGRTLSRVASRQAFEALLHDEADAALLAAGLLSAMATRGESSDELAGVVDVLLARVGAPPVDPELAAAAVDVCGTGGDGLNTFNISTTAAFVVAGAGVPVAKHGNRAVSSACGSADVMAALGVEIEMAPSHAAMALGSARVTFLYAPLYHTVMRRIANVRRELGVRTVFNLAGPLANPVGVKRQIVGVDRPARVELVAKALATRGVVHALVFSNDGGGDELLPFGTTRVAEVRGGGLRNFRVTAADFGLPAGSPEELRGGGALENAEILRRVLAGEPGPRRDAVLMNAAAALVVAGRAATFLEGTAMAARSIDEGAAGKALERLVAASRGEPSW